MVLSITNSFPFGAPGWVSVTGFLPATLDKYDIQLSDNGGNSVSLYAVSIWEYEA